MPYCTKGGAAVAEASRFAPGCGQRDEGRVMFGRRSNTSHRAANSSRGLI